MKLLYAEDEAAMSEAVVDILTYHNYMVDPVYDGEEALAYAQSGHYDGIILDIMMPKLDGLEVLRRLRAEGCRTPILLLTAKAEVEDQVQGLDLGADDYLPKPFSMDLLLGPGACHAPPAGGVHPHGAAMRKHHPEPADLPALREWAELPALQAGVPPDGGADFEQGHLPLHRGFAHQGVGL